MVESIGKGSYKVKILKYEVIDKSYANYMMLVTDPNKIQFYVKDRYSSIQAFCKEVKKSVPKKEGIPKFPAGGWLILNKLDT